MLDSIRVGQAQNALQQFGTDFVSGGIGLDQAIATPMLRRTTPEHLPSRSVWSGHLDCRRARAWPESSTWQKPSRARSSDAGQCLGTAHGSGRLLTQGCSFVPQRAASKVARLQSQGIPMTSKRPILLSQAHVTELEIQAVVRSVKSGWVTALGPDVDSFEAEICAFTRAKYAVALSSGTAALHLGLLGLGIGPSDDVIVPSLTFGATAFAVTYTGASPVFLDVDEGSWGLDPEILESVLDSRADAGRPVAAIIPVDLFGRSADYDRILPIAARYGVPVLIDAAESLGATHGDQFTGTMGRAGMY